MSLFVICLFGGDHDLFLHMTANLFLINDHKSGLLNQEMRLNLELLNLCQQYEWIILKKILLVYQQECIHREDP